MWSILCHYLFIINRGYSIEIFSFVLMPNHFHLICRDPNRNLPDAMEYFMRESSRQVGRISGRINKIWGGPYHNSLIDNALYFFHAYKYVYRNPIEASLCNKAEDYPFSSLSILLGQRHSIIPISEDKILFDDSPEKALEWINASYKNVERESIKKALRKSEFRLRKDPQNRKPLPLENWDSVPFSRDDYEK